MKNYDFHFCIFSFLTSEFPLVVANWPERLSRLEETRLVFLTSDLNFLFLPPIFPLFISRSIRSPPAAPSSKLSVSTLSPPLPYIPRSSPLLSSFHLLFMSQLVFFFWCAPLLPLPPPSSPLLFYEDIVLPLLYFLLCFCNPLILSSLLSAFPPFFPSVLLSILTFSFSKVFLLFSITSSSIFYQEFTFFNFTLFFFSINFHAFPFFLPLLSATIFPHCPPLILQLLTSIFCSFISIALRLCIVSPLFSFLRLFFSFLF